MGAPEEVRIERRQQLFQGPAIRLAFHVLCHHGNHAVLNGGVADVLLVHQKQAVIGLQQHLVGLRPLLLQHLHQRLNLVGRRGFGLLGAHGFFHHLQHALFLKGLQKVIERAHLKGLDRVLVKGRGKDDARQRNLLFHQLLDDAKAVQSRHLHVQKDQVGRVFLDQGNGLDAVLALSNDLHVVEVAQKVAELLTGKLFIVHDDDRKRHWKHPPWGSNRRV